MKKVLLMLAVVLAICLSVVSAQAVTSPFFAYDDFTLTFGSAGNPGSGGSVFTADGKLLEYSNPLQVDGWFVLSGSTIGAQLVGTQYDTTYTGTLKIYSLPNGGGTLLWSGTGSLKTIVNADGSTFPAIYPRPASFAGQPTNYNSIGDGLYNGVGVGDWASIIKMNIDWLGSYNWAYDVSSNGMYTPNTTQQYGNVQGGISIPEPTSLLLLGFGLMGLAGIRRKFFKS